MFNKNQHDCSTKKCKNDEHGNIITAAITKRMISDDKLGAFIAKTCKNFTDLLDNEVGIYVLIIIHLIIISP